MIVIEPVGVQVPLQEGPRYPGKVILPVLVPPSPEGSERAPPPEKKSSLWFFALIAGAVGLIGSSGAKTPGLGEAKSRSPNPRKPPTDRLYWLWIAPGKWWDDAVSIPKSKLPDYKEKAMITSGSLYPIYAESADHARYALKSDPRVRRSYAKTVATEEGAKRRTARIKARAEKAATERSQQKIDPRSQAWQMTPKEYTASMKRIEARYRKMLKEAMKGEAYDSSSPYGRIVSQRVFKKLKEELALPSLTFTDMWGAGHRFIAEAALEQGKPVPGKVLRQYPDLQPAESQLTLFGSAESEGITAGIMDFLEQIPVTKRKPMGSSKKRGERPETYDACLLVYGDQCDSPGDANYDKIKNTIQLWGYDRMSQVFYDYRRRPGTLLENLRNAGEAWDYSIKGRAAAAKALKELREPRQDEQLTLFSGRIANCAIWIPDGKDGWKCGAYGRVCDSPTCATPADPKLKQSKVCVTTQKVFSGFYDRMITRCKRYEASCTGPACMPFTMPYPEAEAERTEEPTQSEVRSMAQWMAEEYNEQTFKKEPYLARQILSRGGIKPPWRPSALKPLERQVEEYTMLPLFLRNKKGMPIDEMAMEMGYEYEDELRQDILKAYPAGKKKKRRKTWEDFQEAAYSMIEEGMEAGTWQGLLGGSPARVWQSTLQEFTALQREKDDPSLPSQLNWILERTGVNPEGYMRVFRGDLPGHMKKKLQDWLFMRHNEPGKWLEDKRITIDMNSGRKSTDYIVKHPFYTVVVRFWKDGSVLVTEDRANYHADSLRTAIAQGKAVPRKVLMEYAPYMPEAKQALDMGSVGLGDRAQPWLSRMPFTVTKQNEYFNKIVQDMEYKISMKMRERGIKSPLMPGAVMDALDRFRKTLYELRRPTPGYEVKGQKDYYTLRDRHDAARRSLERQIEAIRQEPEQLRLLGQDLFPGLRRELKLEPAHDPATSDDPVIACMQRLGWTIPRMDELKASISEKLTVDLFTGKIKRLSAAEKEYQRVIGQCLVARSGTAGILGATRRIRPKQIRWNPRDLNSAINAAIREGSESEREIDVSATSV